jgi:tetratricopeptide (TPR) repeat protein
MPDKINNKPVKTEIIVYIILALVTLAVFWQVNQYNFVFDDAAYVTGNSHVRSGLTPSGVGWAFGTKETGLWNPLVWISLMFDYQLHGLNAGGYHLTNLILHVISVLLLLGLFHRMTGAIWRSAFIAVIFALHPLHVESVAWIAERKDVLSAFFWMLTLYLYVCYTQKPVIKRYLFVLFSFTCALMSKPMAVTLPFVMLLLDYWPLSRLQSRKIETMPESVPAAANKENKKNKSKKAELKKNISAPVVKKLPEPESAGIIPFWQIREKLPFFVLSAIVVIVTLIGQDASTGIMIPFGSRIANALITFVLYMGKTFWPYNMAVFYPFPEHIAAWQVAGASLLIAVISAAVIKTAKRLPYLFAGWLWFAITIAPVIGIIQVSTAAPYAMADRYHYLPSIGLAIMLAWGIPLLFPRENIRKNILFPAAIAVFAMMVIISWQQCRYWKNSIELYSRALQVTKNNPLAHINRGAAYAESGQYQLALGDYNEAIRLNPNDAVSFYNRGNLYGRDLGRYQSAIDDFSEAISLKPDYPEAYANRGISYASLGRYPQAIEDFTKAVYLKPDYADAYNNRAVIYLQQGGKEPGCRDARTACQLGNCKALEMGRANGLCN